MRSVRTLICAALISAAPAAALAQPAAKADAGKTRTAKQYVAAGLAAQSAKEYETAVAMYQKAYDLVPLPVLLFNIGQAQRLAGNDAQARLMYQRYLAAEPTGAQAKLAQDFLGELDAKAATQAAAAATAAADADRVAAASRDADAQPAETTRPAATPTMDASATLVSGNPRAHSGADGDARAGRPLRIGGLAVAGAGVVGVGVAIAFGLKASSLSDELSEPGAPFDPGKVDDGRSAERMSIVAGIAGGALIAGGVVLYYLGHKQKSEHVARVSLVLTPEHAGLAFTGVLP